MSSIDKLLETTYSTAKIKLGGSTLKSIYFIISGSAQHCKDIIPKATEALSTSATLYSTYYTNYLVFKNLLDRIESYKIPDEVSSMEKKQFINSIFRCCSNLVDIALYDEEVNIHNNEFNGLSRNIIEDLDHHRLIQPSKGGFSITGTGNFIFLKPGDLAGYDILKVKEVREFDPAYKWLIKDGSKYIDKTKGLTKDNFNPNEDWYVGVKTELPRLKTLAESRLNKAIIELKLNYDKHKTYDSDFDQSPVESGDYTIVPSKIYLDRNSRHRTKQVLLIEINDSLRLMKSNHFADKWDRADGFKKNANDFMVISKKVIEDLPQLLASAGKTIIEPLSAAVVTPVGPAVVVTNMVQIMNTVTRTKLLLAGTSASLSNVLGLMTLIFLDKFEQTAAIVGTISALVSIISKIQKVLDAFPSV